MKKESATIGITPKYQRAFISTILGNWLLETVFEVHELISHYTSNGAWTFQISTWIYPALLFALSLGFTLTRYRAWMKRIFFATFLSTAVLAVYTMVALIDSLWYRDVYSVRHPLGVNATTWQIFGNDWLIMGVVMAMYIGVLLWVSSRRRA